MYFDKENNLILREDTTGFGAIRIFYISARDVKMAFNNMKYKEMPFWMASPLQELTREQAAFILANFKG